MRVIAQTQKCVATGICAMTCPQVFDQRDEDGVVRVVDEYPPLVLLARVKLVVDLCPSLVFRLENEDETGELTVVEENSGVTGRIDQTAKVGGRRLPVKVTRVVRRGDQSHRNSRRDECDQRVQYDRHAICGVKKTRAPVGMGHVS